MPISNFPLSMKDATALAEKLSPQQLVYELQYNAANSQIPAFIAQSVLQRKMQDDARRQAAMSAQQQRGNQTVADSQIKKAEEMGGIASMSPQFAAKGGITRASSLSMGYSKELPEEAQKILKMRYDQMKDLEEPDYIPPQYAAEGDLLESQVPSDRQKDRPLTSREIADMLLHPVKMTESGGRQSAISPKGARGVMQIMPKTGPEAAKLAGLPWDYNKYANDEEYNTKLGHAYLTSMIDRFGDTEKALAAYNWGPGNLSKALEKASASGRDWKTFLPTETQNYIGKVLGQNQAYLPARQEPQGAEAESGVDIYDKGFMPEGVRIQGGDKYPYPTPDSSSKGLDALRYAYSLANTRQGQPPLGRKNGGPLYLQQGNDGTVVSSNDEGKIIQTDSGRIMVLPTGEKIPLPTLPGEGKQSIPSKIYDETKRIIGDSVKSLPSRSDVVNKWHSIGRDLEGIYTGLGIEENKKRIEGQRVSTPEAPYMMRDSLPGFGDDESYQQPEPTTSKAGRFFSQAKDFFTLPKEIEERTNRIKELYKQYHELDVGPFTQETDRQREERERKQKVISDEIKRITSGESSGITSVPQRQTAITSTPPRPSILDQARGITQGAYPIDSYTGQDQGKAGIPSARPALAPAQIAPIDSSGKTIGTPPAGPIGTPPAGPTAEDTSFNSVMSQVQKAIGSKVPDELQDQMKDFQKNLAQMRNDKVVDALFAAAKTLAGQRMGQRNFGDAIANAGLAAQEAQKRIYKAEDDMRKYRGDLLKAQDTNNREAATIAMNRIVQLDHDKKGLQVAMMQAQKAHDTASMQMDRYEKMYERGNRADAIKALNAEILKLTPDPEKAMLQSDEDKRTRQELIRRRDALISGAEGAVSPPTQSTEIPQPPAGFNRIK